MVSFTLVTAYLLPFAAVLSSVNAADSSPEDWDNCDEIPTISTTASPTADPTTTSASPISTTVTFSGPGYLEGYYNGIQRGCLITAGTWYAGMCAKITAIPLGKFPRLSLGHPLLFAILMLEKIDDGFTISTSKGPCAVTNSVLNCAASTTPSVFNVSFQARTPSHACLAPVLIFRCSKSMAFLHMAAARRGTSRLYRTRHRLYPRFPAPLLLPSSGWDSR